MPATLGVQELQGEHENDNDLEDPLHEGNTSLKLQKLSTNAAMSICCGISTGYVRPYIPAPLRQKVFVIIHDPSHPSSEARCQHRRQKYV
jgi:hypothetical protein